MPDSPFYLYRHNYRAVYHLYLNGVCEISLQETDRSRCGLYEVLSQHGSCGDEGSNQKEEKSYLFHIAYALYCFFYQHINEQVINIPILYDGIWHSTFILEAILQ